MWCFLKTYSLLLRNHAGLLHLSGYNMRAAKVKMYINIFHWYL